MQTHKEQIEQLWHKWLLNEATPEEVDRLMTAIDESDENLHFIQEGFARETVAQKGFTAMEDEQKLRLLQHLKAGHMISDRPPVRRMQRLWRAGRVAAVVILLAGGVWLWKQQRPAEMADSKAISARDIAPGSNGAVLTLADGSEVVLDSTTGGVIAQQNGAVVVLTNGLLAYQASGNSSEAVMYNSMRTPRGRQFQLTLPDGTRVWLNSASSLRYPTVFGAKERRVEVTGEAYFEVAQNAAIPFKVSVAGGAEVDVLGTQFNINAYNEGKAIRTTLLQGSVRVRDTAGKASGVILKPGQQAIVQQDITVADKVNLDQVMAWKNGLFDFEGMGLQEAMQQLERWYDIEVVYENGIPDNPFGGAITRNVSLDGLLKMLKEGDLSFRMEKGRKLIITK